MNIRLTGVFQYKKFDPTTLKDEWFLYEPDLLMDDINHHFLVAWLSGVNNVFRTTPLLVPRGLPDDFGVVTDNDVFVRVRGTSEGYFLKPVDLGNYSRSWLTSGEILESAIQIPTVVGECLAFFIDFVKELAETSKESRFVFGFSFEG